MFFYISIFIILLTQIFCASPDSKRNDSIFIGHETSNTSNIETNEFTTIEPSRIPGAGMGVYSKKFIPSNTIIGDYKGKFLTDEEYWKLVNSDQWHYVMGLDECSYKYTKGIKYIDGRFGNFTTRINYAPTEFQNVKFQKICEAPYVNVVSTKDIQAGDEIYVDYGPNYIYDFMENPAVKEFFAKEKKKLKK